MSEKINFLYKFSDDYNPIYVNGAYGGATPKNEIIVHFFLERTPVPKVEELEINDDGTPGAAIIVSPENHNKNVIRYVSTGVVMNLETAISIRNWLNGHIEKLQENQK